MKLTIADLRIRGRNEQIIAKIKAKFGNVEHFARVIGLSEKTVNQYLKQNKDFSDNFKQNLVNHLGDYNSLSKSAEQQVEELIDTLTRDIYSYKEESDIKVLEEALKMSMDYLLPRCVAKCYRNMGKHYSLIGYYNFSMRFYNLAEISAQQAEDINIECMVIGEMISVHTFLNEIRPGERLFREYEEKFEKADPYYKYWYYYYAAVLYITDRSYPYAKAVLAKALAYVTSDYMRLTCLSLLGVCEKREGNFDSALFYYNQALELAELDRNKAMCYNNLANLYISIGNKSLAKENIEAAIKHIKFDDITEYLEIYNTYMEIMGDEENIPNLIDILDGLSMELYPQYILDSLSIAIRKSKETKRLQNIISRYIKLFKDNKKFTNELYKFQKLVVSKERKYNRN